ncbi:MAG: lantibiotic dehydratase family protein [Bacteroidales bacterium]
MGKRITYDPYDHFMLRAPLLPVNFLSTIPDSPDQLFPYLKELWKDALIREGLVLGSYEFSQRIEQEFNGGKSTLPDPGLLYSLLRYLCRFSSRCTPFGTFAGFSTGKIGSETAVNLGERVDHQLHARPDMEYLMGIARLLESDRSIREKLIFTANTSLYRVGSRWHYVEVKIPTGKSRKIYDIVTIDDSGVIGDILEFCYGGRNLNEIRKYLITGGWAEPEVLDFVESLVDSQVIVTGLEPVICGPEYIECLISQLTQEFENHDVVRSLVKLKNLFDLMNQPSSVLANLPMIDPILATIPVYVNRNHLIQVDMKLSNSAMTIDSHLSGQILLGLRIIKALTSASSTDVLKGFRDSFIKRYGDRKILLVKALDPETGIGLEGSVEGYWTDPVPWIDDLRWGPAFSPGSAEGNQGNGWLVGRFYEVIRIGQQYVNLESSDLQSIGIHNGNWPTQMTAMVELFEPESPGELNIHLLHGSSGNPAYLLGRFGFADPDSTHEWINQLIEEEKTVYPDMVFAEVVHLPEDRTGNVLQRPAFLDFEIPYLARSAKIKDQQIPVTDLLVAMENQRIVLYSATSGKKIHPYSTNAYNHQLGNLAVYKFLHRIQLQDPDLAYKPDWGEVIRQAPFIPGIRFKNLILSPPVWLIRCDDIAKWIHIERNELDLSELIAWKNERQMPDEMLWMSSDQELYFNWTNSNLLMALWDTIRNYSFVRIRPFYLSPGTPVKSPDGSHANQFVFCFRKS